MRIRCAIEECDLEDDAGREVAGIRATCSRCDHETTAYGTGERSVRRALVAMREECPEDESNYYAADEDGGESAMPDPIVRPWWERGR